MELNLDILHSLLKGMTQELYKVYIEDPEHYIRRFDWEIPSDKLDLVPSLIDCLIVMQDHGLISIIKLVPDVASPPSFFKMSCRCNIYDFGRLCPIFLRKIFPSDNNFRN